MAWSLVRNKVVLYLQTQPCKLVYRRAVACCDESTAAAATQHLSNWSSHFRGSSQDKKEGGSQVVPGCILALSVGSAATALSLRRSEAHCASTQRVELGPVDEYRDGTLIDLPVGESGVKSRSSIVVARYQGSFFVIDGTCPHSGAKLANGVLSFEKGMPVLTSPQEDASFYLKSGKSIRGPRIDGVATYPAEVSRGKLSTRLPKDFLSGGQVKSITPTMSRKNPRDKQIFAIVGGGAAASAAAETLRQEGFTGQIVMLTQEQYDPYDRTMLSKKLQPKASDLTLRTADFLKQHGIEVVHQAIVTGVDAQAQKISYEVRGETRKLEYDKVLVATGCTPRRLGVPGSEFPGVFTLRTPEDAEKIAQLSCKGNKIVLVGGSFTSLELASTLRAKKCDVTIIAMETYPFERVFGRKIGGAIARILHDKGVEWLGNASVRLFRGAEDTGVNGVELDDGEVLPADAVVLCIGASPNTNMIEGVSLDNSGGILVGPHLNSEDAPTMFAAGDVCTYPSVRTGEKKRIEHWNVAVQQGRVAARNMLNQSVPFTTLPYFSTKLFGMTLQCVGDRPKDLNQVYLEGDLSEHEFIAYITEEDDIRAVVTMNRDSVCAACAELMKHGQMPKVSHIQIGAVNGDVLLQAQMRTSALPPAT